MGAIVNNEDCILKLSLKQCIFQVLEQTFSSGFPYPHTIS